MMHKVNSLKLLESNQVHCDGRALGTGWLGQWEERRGLEEVWSG